jgi:hypothetical protein
VEELNADALVLERVETEGEGSTALEVAGFFARVAFFGFGTFPSSSAG